MADSPQLVTASAVKIFPAVWHSVRINVNLGNDSRHNGKGMIRERVCNVFTQEMQDRTLDLIQTVPPPAMPYVRHKASDMPDGPAKTRLTELESEFLDMFQFKNNQLPAKYRDRKNGGRSIASILRMLAKKKRKVSQRDADKLAKASRIGQYRSSVDMGHDIEFNEDEHRVYTAHLRFCRIVGLITQDDIDG